MQSEINAASICTVVTKALKSAANSDALSADVTAASGMGSPKEWDSLSFVAVFTAISAAFDVELEDDDAFHFQSIEGIETFLNDILDA